MQEMTVRHIALGLRPPCFYSCLCCWLATWPWSNQFLILCLSFFIC